MPTDMVQIEKVKSPNKTAALQSEVDQVVNIMNNNIEKVVSRGEKLSSIQTKTEDLSQASFQFKKSSKKLESEMWWKNIMLSLVIAGIAGVAVTVALINFFNSKDK